MNVLIAAALILPLFDPLTLTAQLTEVDSQDLIFTRRELRHDRREARHRARYEERLAEARAVPLSASDDVPVATPHPVSADGAIPDIIRSIFGPYGDQAVSVAWCESRFNPLASNGRFFGLFQMGDTERGIYGGSSTDPAEQTRAAYRYFVAAGGWGPWSMGACA